MSKTTDFLKLHIWELPADDKEAFDYSRAVGNNFEKIEDNAKSVDTNKVDKIEGKELSTNDFTDEYKQKLDNLSNYDDSVISNEILDIQKEQTEQNSYIEILQKEDSLNKQEISDIKTEQTTQNTNIQNNTDEIEALKVQHAKEIAELEDLIPTSSTEEAESLTISDSARYPFNELKISGNSKQDVRSGKNKLKLEDGEITVNGVTATVKGGEVTLNGTATTTTFISFAPNLKSGASSDTSGNPLFEVSNANKYTMSVSELSGTKNVPTESKLYITAQKNSGQFNIQLESSVHSITVDLSADEQIYGVWLLAVANTVFSNYKFNMQIEEGETATDYEEFGTMPSPEYPSEIRNCGDNINFKVQNKNWFDEKYLKQIEGYNTYDKATGLWTTNSYGGYFLSIFYQVVAMNTIKNINYLPKMPKNSKVTITLFDFVNNSNVDSNFINIQFVDNNGTMINNKTVSSNIITIETPDEECYMDIRRTNNGGTFSFSHIQIEAEEIATDYVEHEEQNITFPLAEGQVLHEGDCLSDDGIHQTKQTIIFDGTENFAVNTNYTTDELLVAQLLIEDAKASTKNVISNYFKYKSTNDESDIIRFVTKYLLITLDKNKFSTVEELKTYLAEQYANGTPVTIEYELAEEIVIAYTEEQQEAYNKIKEIYSYKGTTHITCDDEISCKFQAEYVQDLQAYIKQIVAESEV